MTTATVTVRGQAVVLGEPDEIVIGLEISALEQTAEAAHAEIARRSQTLNEVLTEIGVPRGARSTAGVSVDEEREFVDRNYVHRGYRGRNNLSVKLPDAILVGRIMREATEKAQARISGPFWRIALDNPARTEACRRAAADARRKAEAYASALGVRLGTVESVTEPGLRHRTLDDQDSFLEVRSMAADAPAPEIEVTSSGLDIPAVVDVVFRLEA